VQLNTLVKVLSAASEQLVSSKTQSGPDQGHQQQHRSGGGPSQRALSPSFRNGLVKISDIADSTYDLAQQTKNLNKSLVNPLEQSLINQEQALTEAESSIYAWRDLPELKKIPATSRP
jgi:hypothetical protein